MKTSITRIISALTVLCMLAAAGGCGDSAVSSDTGKASGSKNNVISDDFRKTTVLDLSNNEEIMAALGGEIAPSDVEDYAISRDGGLIYNPISQEAKKTGEIGKYNGKEAYTGKIELNGNILEYEVPKEVTAYDCVPVKYRLKKKEGATEPVHVQITTNEESERTKGNTYFDNNLPDKVSVEFEYLGYVNGTFSGGEPVQSANIIDDVQGTKYPNYDTSELIKSGTVKTADITWFRFRFTNTGNTIIDGEGNGSFDFAPVLEKKNGGNWEYRCQIENTYQRLIDSVYPGESGEFWVTFPNEYSSFSEGEYRIVITGHCGNSRSDPDEKNTIWDGYDCTRSVFEFKAAADAGITTPNKVITTVSETERNTWLRTCEEFMSTYESFLDPGTETEEGIIYVQPCPWAENFTIKLIDGTKGSDIKQAVVPVKVESDSVKISFNADNINYIIKEDGTRYPIINTQIMSDMRSNTQLSPYPDEVIINTVLDMKEAGINMVNSTQAFAWDVDGSAAGGKYVGAGGKLNNDAYKFSMEVLRAMGMTTEGAGYYSFCNVAKVANTLKKQEVAADDFGTASRLTADYIYNRYGDTFWNTAKGTRIYTIDQTMGWMRTSITHSRYNLSGKELLSFTNWLTDIYGNVDALNKAYGSNYKSISSINPQTEGTRSQEWVQNNNMDNTYCDWSLAMTDYDIFRSLLNTQRMIDASKSASDGDMGKTEIVLRSEGGIWIVPGINPNTKNARYRQIYYGQRREAVIAEIVASSGVVYGDSDYIHVNYRPSEVAELTKRSVEAGIIPMHLPHFSCMKDLALNSKYGDMNATLNYNTASLTYGALVKSRPSVFKWFKATYENGGIPGLIWSDYCVNCNITATQYKEVKFFSEKLNEAVNTPEGQKWATEFEKPKDNTNASPVVAHDYPASYVSKKIKNTKRINIYETLIWY